MYNKGDVDEFLLEICVETLRDKENYHKAKNNFLEYFPEFNSGYDVKQENQFHIYTVGEHTLNAIANGTKNLMVRWALALHDIGKPVVKTYDEKGVAHFYLHHLKSMDIAGGILDRYKFDDNEKTLILKLVKNHDRDIKSKSAIRRLLKEISVEEVNLLLEVKTGDSKAQNPIYIKERIYLIESIRNKLNEIVEEEKKFKISDLDITGKDIVDIGIIEGREIGYILNSLYKLVLEDNIKNRREQLIEKSLQIWKNMK